MVRSAAMNYHGANNVEYDVRRYPNLRVLSKAAAGFVSGLAERCVEKRRVFTFVLSGGSTPRLLYGYLAQPPFNTMMPWEHIYFFWGDERCVPADHPDSNFPMAHQALISKVPVPPSNVHRMRVELHPPERAAEDYERTLRDFFARQVRDSVHPFPSSKDELCASFDLVLLGVGKDGHTACLLPGTEVLGETSAGFPRSAPLAAAPLSLGSHSLCPCSIRRVVYSFWYRALGRGK